MSRLITRAADAGRPQDPEAHDLGLAADLPTLLAQSAKRRQSLRRLGAAVLPMLPLVTCGGGDSASGSSTASDAGSSSSSTSGNSTSSSASSGGSTSGSTSSTSAVINENTAGPYPGDGANSSSSGVAYALELSGYVRRDIRSSIGGASGVAGGLPLTVKLVLVNTNGACASVADLAVYL